MEAIDILKSAYIRELLAKGAREDMRGMFDFRPVKVETGLMENAEGSAQVDMGSTRVLAGVKMTVEEPMEDTPDQGNLMVMAELLPLAHADFETGPPSPASIELARVVDRGIRAAKSIDLTSLSIDAEKAWTVFIDLYVLNYDGNLFDASALAAMSALATTKMPKQEDGKAIYSERKDKLKIDSIALSTTFGKIGNALVLDMDLHEENTADTRLTITTDGKVVRAMQKGLGGSLTMQEVEDLVGKSSQKYKELYKHVEKVME
jgi:exosome complex component RRP42